MIKYDTYQRWFVNNVTVWIFNVHLMLIFIQAYILSLVGGTANVSNLTDLFDKFRI